MPLHLQSIEKRQTGDLYLRFCKNRKNYQTRITLDPRGGMKFHNPAAKSALMDTGTETRTLCNILLKFHQGSRLKLPRTITDPHTQRTENPSPPARTRQLQEVG